MARLPACPSGERPWLSSGTTSPSRMRWPSTARSTSSTHRQQQPPGGAGSGQTVESLFMRELIKSMRDATVKSGLLEGEQANLGRTCWTSSCRSTCRACRAV